MSIEDIFYVAKVDQKHEIREKLKIILEKYDKIKTTTSLDAKLLLTNEEKILVNDTLPLMTKGSLASDDSEEFIFKQKIEENLTVDFVQNVALTLENKFDSILQATSERQSTSERAGEFRHHTETKNPTGAWERVV